MLRPSNEHFHPLLTLLALENKRFINICKTDAKICFNDRTIQLKETTWSSNLFKRLVMFILR